MERLTEEDLRLLVRIQIGNLPKEFSNLKEFSGHDKKEMQVSLDKLAYNGLILLDKDIWTVTYDGEQFLQAQNGVLQDFYDDVYSSKFKLS